MRLFNEMLVLRERERLGLPPSRFDVIHFPGSEGPSYELERMYREDERFQREMDEALQKGIDEMIEYIKKTRVNQL